MRSEKFKTNIFVLEPALVVENGCALINTERTRRLNTEYCSQKEALKKENMECYKICNQRISFFVGEKGKKNIKHFLRITFS